jgi:hypothetical protein
MSDDPWGGLSKPLNSASINARRVDETNKWDFYWGRDSDGRYLLVLRHDAASRPQKIRLPRLKGVDVFDQSGSDKDKPALVLRLLDFTLRDIFHRLCLDIIAVCATATLEQEAVATAVARTWRWHHLLRGGDRLLSAQEQIGLIGELLVLERYMLQALPPSQAIAAWGGPLGTPQDFLVGRTAIESKARGISEATEVKISSEYQLDDKELANLFLHLCVFETADVGSEDGFTVSDTASRLKTLLSASDERVTERYDALLAAAGFRYEDDYSAYRWRGGERNIYRLTDGFPRLVASLMPAGITNVRYNLFLSECAPFLVAPLALSEALLGGRDG